MQYLQIGLKYLYSIVLIFLTQTVIDNSCYSYILICFSEMLMIFCLSDILIRRFGVLGKLFNFITLLLFNIQLTVLYFSGTYLSLAMVNNLDSIKDLSGKFYIYIPFILALLISIAIPAKRTQISVKKNELGCVIILFVEIASVVILHDFNSSPIISLIDLGKQYVQQKQLEDIVVNVDAMSNLFYCEGIEDCIKKPDKLPDTPNVILIFTEGLSQGIILDERNIMPRIKEIQSKSINFENYYNHTFATYNGISGQLYSGFQREQTENNMLISLQDILKSVGYTTIFINVEPFNEVFTTYLSNMRFDNLITDESLAIDLADCISDKNAYDILMRACEEQEGSKNPFFISMYTVGTHINWVCPNEKYADGSNEMLNKFYNVDYQFGKFIDKFNTSELAKDTIIIFTTDHATYAENDFVRTFPNQNRNYKNIDQIPLFIYYQGIENYNIDVKGKNSLDLTPTILDFLDISKPNYFLGTSLFGDKDNNYDTIFSEALANTYSTKNSEIAHLDNEKLSWFRENMTNYFAAKIKVDVVPYITTKVSNDYTCLEILLENAADYEQIWFLVWSDSKNQEDSIWFEGVKNSDGNWECNVDLCDYQIIGEYYIEAYAGKEAPDEKLIPYSLFIDHYPVVPIKTDVYSNGDSNYIKIEYNPTENEDRNIWFVVWSDKDGEDDIKFYPAKKDINNSWIHDVKLEDHFNDTGKYNIHVYAGDNTPEKFMLNTVAWID